MERQVLACVVRIGRRGPRPHDGFALQTPVQAARRSRRDRQVCGIVPFGARGINGIDTNRLAPTGQHRDDEAGGRDRCDHRERHDGQERHGAPLAFLLPLEGRRRCSPRRLVARMVPRVRDRDDARLGEVKAPARPDGMLLRGRCDAQFRALLIGRRRNGVAAVPGDAGFRRTRNGSLLAHLNGRLGKTHERLDTLERLGEGQRGAQAARGVHVHRSPKYQVQFLGGVGAPDGAQAPGTHAHRDRDRRVIPDRVFEGAAPHEQGPQRGPQCPHVLRRVRGGASVVLLGRRPHDGEALQAAVPALADARAHAKVGEDRRLVGVQHDVARLNVAVHVAHPVQHLHARGNADDQIQRRGHVHRVSTHLIGDVRHRAVLHDEEFAPVIQRTHAVQIHDGRVAGHAGHRVGLVANRLVSTLHIRARNLDGDVTRRNLLVIQVNVRETARPERTNPPESLDARAGSHHSCTRHDLLLTLDGRHWGPPASSPSSSSSAGPRLSWLPVGFRRHLRASERSEKRRLRRTHRLADDASERLR